MSLISAYESSPIILLPSFYLQRVSPDRFILPDHVLCRNNRGVFYGFGEEVCCRDLVKIALTVPSGNPVLFAIFRAPILTCWFSERTARTVSSGRGGLPSLLPLARATLSPAIVRSDILTRSCMASVANIETITSLNGPVESSHWCFYVPFYITPLNSRVRRLVRPSQFFYAI